MTADHLRAREHNSRQIFFMTILALGMLYLASCTPTEIQELEVNTATPEFTQAVLAATLTPEATETAPPSVTFTPTITETPVILQYEEEVNSYWEIAGSIGETTSGKLPDITAVIAGFVNHRSHLESDHVEDEFAKYVKELVETGWQGNETELKLLISKLTQTWGKYEGEAVQCVDWTTALAQVEDLPTIQAGGTAGQVAGKLLGKFNNDRESYDGMSEGGYVDGMVYFLGKETDWPGTIWKLQYPSLLMSVNEIGHVMLILEENEEGQVLYTEANWNNDGQINVGWMDKMKLLKKMSESGKIIIGVGGN